MTNSPTLIAAGGGQHRDEAVQFAVEPDLAKDLGPVALHAAVVIVQLDTPVVQLTMALKTQLGQTLCQGSCRFFFQPLMTSLPCLQRGQKARESRRGRPAGRRRES